MKNSKAPLLLSKDSFLERLGSGRFDIGILSAGFGTFGGKHGAWGFKGRRVKSHIFYAVVRGKIEATWGSDSALIGPGSAFWLAPGVEHDFSIPPPEQPISLFYFRADFTDEKKQFYRAKQDGILLPDVDRLRYVFEEIVALARGNVTYAAPKKQGLFLLLCSAFLEGADRKVMGRRFTAAQCGALEKRAARVDGRFLIPVELANELDLSPEYFARLFLNTFGLKPRTWIVQQRIRRSAATLLESPASIGEVAAEAGYEDTYFFSRQFRQVMGCSPREYRRNQRMG